MASCYADGTCVLKDEKEAVSWYRKAAEQGHQKAQYCLSLCYANGMGVVQDEEKAAVWYRKATEQEHQETQYRLGVRYEDGIVVPEDEKEAAVWYRKAAEQGHQEAQYYLAVRYEEGRGIPKDEEEAVSWYRKAAEQGHREAQYHLGMCYIEGRGVAKDEKEAVSWYHKAGQQMEKMRRLDLRPFKQEHKEAQYCLGVCYAEGRGVLKDEEEANSWYLKAAQNGYLKAQIAIAKRCVQGLYVPTVNTRAAKAIFWYGKAIQQEENHEVIKEIGHLLIKNPLLATSFFSTLGRKTNQIDGYHELAEQNDPEAQYKLGLCYSQGKEVADVDYFFWGSDKSKVVLRDEKEAVSWFRKAAEQGYKEAQYSLALCYANGTGVEEDEKEATQWFLMAARQGHLEAQYNTAIRYENGTGILRDDHQAAHWYRKAAERWHQEAQSYLGKCYANGFLGLEKDEQEAMIWYGKAAEQSNKKAGKAIGELLVNNPVLIRNLFPITGQTSAGRGVKRKIPEKQDQDNAGLTTKPDEDRQNSAENKYENKEENKPLNNILDQLLKAFQIWDDGGFQEAINRSLSSAKEQKSDFDSEAYVKSFGLNYKPIPGDGKCFCRAVYDQLQGTSLLREDEKDHTSLQSTAIQYILDHIDEFKESIVGSPHTFILRQLENKSEWADHHIIHALAKSKRLTLVILNSDQSITVFRHPNEEKTVYLSYKMGLHYDSAPLLSGASIHDRLSKLIKDSGVGEWITHPNIFAPLQEEVSTNSSKKRKTGNQGEETRPHKKQNYHGSNTNNLMPLRSSSNSSSPVSSSSSSSSSSLNYRSS